MKSISAALEAHLNGPDMSLAYLWKVKRADGLILGFTTHDLPITYDAGDGDGPLTYEGSTGMASTATEGHADLAVDGLEAAGFLESDSITEADIRAGLYDDAQIWVRLVSWRGLAMGHMTVRAGYTGNVKMRNGAFTAELRGLSQKLTTVVGGTYGEVCRADLGATLANTTSHWICGVNIALYQQTGAVGSVTDDRTIIPAASPSLLQVGSPTPGNPAPAGWFNNGIVKFTSGALNGMSAEIKSWDGTSLVFYLSLPGTPAPGDTFTIEPGCNKGTDCQAKFQNIANKQAEPFIPGMDQLLDYAG